MVGTTRLHIDSGGTNSRSVTTTPNTVVMSGQMKLIEIEKRIPSWALDRRTREAGLRGVAAARAILEMKSSSHTPDVASDMKRYKILSHRH